MFLDQTPTPTRFLRNCEEAGLFQELDDANPFDEDFKSATDDSQNDKGGQKTGKLCHNCLFKNKQNVVF